MSSKFQYFLLPSSLKWPGKVSLIVLIVSCPCNVWRGRGPTIGKSLKVWTSSKNKHNLINSKKFRTQNGRKIWTTKCSMNKWKTWISFKLLSCTLCSLIPDDSTVHDWLRHRELNPSTGLLSLLSQMQKLAIFSFTVNSDGWERKLTSNQWKDFLSNPIQKKYRRRIIGKSLYRRGWLTIAIIMFNVKREILFYGYRDISQFDLIRSLKYIYTKQLPAYLGNKI